MRDDIIDRLRRTLPPFLTVREYCRLLNRSQASAYNDLRNKPGIAVKNGGATRFVTDAVLDEMLRLPAWIPEKDRPRPRKFPRPRRSDKQNAALRRKRDPEVRT